MRNSLVYPPLTYIPGVIAVLRRTLVIVRSYPPHLTVFARHVTWCVGLCPLANDPVKAVTETLQKRIRAQPLAIESLSMAVSAWRFR